MASEDSGSSSGNEKSTHDQDLVWGSGLAIFGNILISGSLNLQKYVHVCNSSREVQRHYTRDPLWWLGLFLMVSGEVCNFTAYGFAPASLVAPLGTTTVIANLFIAALVLKEKVKGENLFGCALAIIGAFVLVTFSGQDEKIQGSYEIIESLSQPIFIGYVVVEITAVASLMVLLHFYSCTHVIIYLLISSITASFTVISAKAVSGMLLLSLSGFSQWSKPVLYAMLLVLIVTALIQIKYLNLAMKSYDATIVVPVNFVIFTASAILAGIIFYKEFLGMSALQVIMFLFGCVLSFVAVYFIAMVKTDRRSGKLSTETEQITPDLIPSWMRANVNIGPVQPSGQVEHLQTAAGVNDELNPVQPESPIIENDNTEVCGGDMNADQVSITSMDMLLDRERMGDQGAEYGTVIGGGK